VRDAELDTITTARRWPVLLRCSARFVKDPADRPAGPGDVLDVIVTFPDGSEVSRSDPAIHDRLSALIGKPARLESLPALSEKRRYRTPQATKADIRRQFTIPDGEPLPDFSLSRCASSPSSPAMPPRSGRCTTHPCGDNSTARAERRSTLPIRQRHSGWRACSPLREQ
jgi:hypothetical protein